MKLPPEIVNGIVNDQAVNILGGAKLTIDSNKSETS